MAIPGLCPPGLVQLSGNSSRTCEDFWKVNDISADGKSYPERLMPRRLGPGCLVSGSTVLRQVKHTADKDSRLEVLRTQKNITAESFYNVVNVMVYI